MAVNMKIFVLVHGAWHGGWCWRRVADRLGERGHRVIAPTLTGLGERTHLMSRDIKLATHITDVVNVFKYERLSDVVLCGHSYAGFVVSGVAELVTSAISSIVFLDAFLPENGQSCVEINRPGVKESVVALARLAFRDGRRRRSASTRTTARGWIRSPGRSRSRHSPTRSR
jgi:pimeloyl-ACP methyl ester carboxylesterase